MAEQVQLQEILGVDKENPFFTLCTNPGQPGKLLVYFGMALLEVVDADPRSPTFKLLLARLYNAGVKPRSLRETFSVAYTSLRRWGEALKSGDSEKLISVLAGRQHPRKLTPEILSFAKTRFYVIYPKNHYSYSKTIRQEILETFGESISGESLRPYFAKWIRALTTTAANIESLSQENSEPEPAHDNLSQGGGTVNLSGNDEAIDDDIEQMLQGPQPIDTLQAEENPKPVANSNPAVDDDLSPGNESRADPANQQDANALASSTAQEENNHKSGQVALEVPPHRGLEQHNRKHAVVLAASQRAPQVMVPSGGYLLCHHAGVLLFSGFLNELGSAITTGGQLITQWLTAILLGAVNIEQTKLLNYPSLECFLGQTLPNRHKQRQGLAEIAKTSCMEELLQLNGQWVGIDQCSDFYYDPHSKHYTGKNNVLKTMC